MERVRVSWVEETAPTCLPVTQVYGFCFSTDSRILLIEHAGHFNLPGGKPEKNESYKETLRREALEEAQVILDDVKLLGYQRVEGDSSLIDGAPYAQVRIIARLSLILPSARDPATGLTYQRHLCLPAYVPDRLQWGSSGDAQAAAACRLAQRVWAMPCLPPQQSTIGEPSVTKHCIAIPE